MEYWCERASCPNGAVFECNKCSSSIFELPPTFGQFCSRDCQFQAYASHSEAHKVLSSFNTKSQSEGKLIESLAVAMKDAANRRLLPALRDGSVFGILMVGSTDSMEGSADFFRLYERLVVLDIYPPGQAYTLEVTLVGPELTSRVPFHHPSGKVTVLRLSGRLHRMFPVDATYNPRAACYTNVGQYSHTAHRMNVSQYMSFSTYDGSPAYAPSSTLSTHYHCAVLRNPGLNLATVAGNPSPSQSPSEPGKGRPKDRELTLREQWEPAVSLLLDSALLTLVINCCSETDKRRATVARLQSMLPSELPNMGSHHHTPMPNALLGSRSSSGCSTPMTSCSPATAQYKSIHSSPGNSLRKFGAPVYSPTMDSETLLGSARGGARGSHNTIPVAQDEAVLDTGYWARIVIPHTRLPCGSCTSTAGTDRFRALSGDSTQSSVTLPSIEVTTSSTGGMDTAVTATYPSGCMYMAFQSRRDSATSAQISFYHYMAEHNPALQVASLQLASELGTGRLCLPAETTQIELEQEAIRRNLVMHPEYYQQLGTTATAVLAASPVLAPIQPEGMIQHQSQKGSAGTASPRPSPQGTPQTSTVKHTLPAALTGRNVTPEVPQTKPLLQQSRTIDNSASSSPALSSHKKVQFQTTDESVSPDAGYRNLRSSDGGTSSASHTGIPVVGDTLITGLPEEGTEAHKQVPLRQLPVMVFKRK